MSYRYVLAAVLLAATSIPAAAQQTTQTDTSKKASTSGTTTTTSNGAVAEPPAAAAPNPNGPSATPGASINSPATTSAPSTTSPSTGTVTTSPAPTSGAASTSPSDATTGASVSGAMGAMGAAGQVQPTSGAVKVDVKVAPTLANSVKISADSAFALARASGTAGEISSAELEMKEKALVYNIKMVKGAGASVVHVDAMTGQVVKDKKYGGLKASGENDKQLKKLEDAKEDSTKARKP